MNIRETIEELKGTCNTIDLDNFTIEELETLDKEIFECSQCGWWYPIDEEVGEGTENICEECNEE